MTIGVYQIQNNQDRKGKRYIGSSVNVELRWSNHRCDLRAGRHVNRHLQRAFEKRGEAAFILTILEECAQDGLLEREQWWLDTAREKGEIYNVAVDATAPTRGRKLSKEHKRKIGDALRNVPKSEGHRKKMRGHKVSKETRRKISQTNQGKRRTREQNMRNAQTTKNAHAEGKYGKEWRKNNALARIGHATSEITRRRIGDSLARPYPALVSIETGEVIPAGVNLSRLCRQRGLTRANLQRVIAGRFRQHKGWTLQSAIWAEGN